MEMVIAGALALMLVMVWYFYRLGRSKGRERGEQWARQSFKEVRETRDLAVKHLRKVQEENDVLRRNIDLRRTYEQVTADLAESKDLRGMTKSDHAQILDRSIRKNSEQRKLGRHSPPPPPPKRINIPDSALPGASSTLVSPHYDPMDAVRDALIVGSVLNHEAPVEAPTTSYEPPCSSSYSDYSSGSTDFGCSDTSSSSSGSGDW